MGIGASREADVERVYQRLSTLYDQQIADETSLRNEEFEQKRALELANRRHWFKYEAALGMFLVIAVAVVSPRYKRPWIPVTIFTPLVMTIGYRYDAAYGEQQSKIRTRAEDLLKKEREKLQLVGGPIALAEVDQRVPAIKRLQQE